MTLLDKLRSLFSRDDIPDEAKLVFERARTPAELLNGLDDLLTRNEMEAGELNREMVNIERKAEDEEAKIRDGALPERQKRNSLLYIKRLRKQMDNYEQRLHIYERNMNLQLSLIGKVQQMEAMKLRGVDEQNIDKFVLDFEEKLEKYHDVMNAAEAHEGRTQTQSSKEERELKALEQQIKSKGKQAEAPPTAEEPKTREAPPPREQPPVPEPGPRRRSIDEVVEHALGTEGAEAAPSGGEKKKMELE